MTATHDVVASGPKITGRPSCGGKVMNAADFSSSSVTAQSWEPYFEDGRETGEIHWLVQAEEGQVSGLWRIGPVEGAEFPYKPAATDTFHVIEGGAELETPDGEKIELVAGASIPSRRDSRPPGEPGRRS
ncbi:hypothetical protein [Streptomyces virginiae]|uniref:hypothetical protein n=1 Tax=Streptomyces virginiae TaxID=1961 RepID=UPI00364BC720